MTGKTLFTDVCTAQQTESVNLGLRKKDTIFINVLFGTTSRIQPLGVCTNKSFKSYIREQFEKQLQKNMNLYVTSQLPASDKGVLVAKWVGNSWTKIKMSLNDALIFETQDI